MNCPKCNSDLLIDRVEKIEDTEHYLYVCINPKCEDYKKAFSPISGEVTEPTITTESSQ